MNNFLRNYKEGCCPLRYGAFPFIIFSTLKCLCAFSPNVGFSKSQKTNLTYTDWQPLHFMMPITSQEVEMSWTAHFKKLRWATPAQLFLTVSCKAFQTSFLLEWHSLILHNFCLALAHDTDINIKLQAVWPRFPMLDICPRLKDVGQIAEEFARLSVKEKQFWWSFWKLSILVLASGAHLSLPMQTTSLFWTFIVWCYLNLGGFFLKKN